MRRFLWLRAAGWLGALAVTSSAVAQEATPPQPEVVRPLTPIPPERLEQMVPKHPGYLGALAPENLQKPRPAPPFDVTGTWFVDLSKGFADYMFGPPYPKFYAPGREALIESAKAQQEGRTYRDAIGQCYPPGMPMLMTRVWPHAFIQLPTAIYVISGFNNSVRTIFLDGRDHSDPDLVVPSYNGESIGRWEGEWTSTKRYNRQDHTDINEANCILQYNANLPGTNLGSETAEERGQTEVEGVANDE